MTDAMLLIHDFWLGSFQVAVGITIFLAILQVVVIVFWLIVGLVEKVRYDVEQLNHEKRGR